MIAIDSNILIAVSVIFGILVLCLIGMLSTYIFLIRKNVFKKEISEEIARVDSEKLLSEVHARSVKVLEDAHKKAREILANAENFMERNEKGVREETSKIGKVYLNKYEAALNEIKLEAVKTIHDTPGEVNKTLERSVELFRKSAETEIAKVHTKLNESFTKAMDEVNSEVEKYKAQRMKKIDESSLEIARSIAKKILARDISSEEHEKVVIKALEEARRQGIFDL